MMSKLKKWVQRRKGKTQKPGPPVFIFAASWRTGSTLLQRVVNASGEVFVWGEPGFLPEARGLFVCLENYLMQVKWRREDGFGEAVGKWIAVVSPDPKRVKDAFLSFFEDLYNKETISLGRARWGFKEVRANAVAHIRFLQTLYPKARFLFLVRDPWDMYQSVKGKKFHANFENPLQPVHVWRNNVSEFLDDSELQESCLLIRYEELVKQTHENNDLLHKIADHLGISICGKMFLELEARTDPSGDTFPLVKDELTSVTRIAGDAAKRLGYELR